MKIDRNLIKYIGKEVANLDASNILGVTQDESCTVYDNLEEKILQIRPKDSYKFGISRSNLMAIQKRIRSKDSQVKLQKGTLKRLQKAFSDVVSGNFRIDNRIDSSFHRIDKNIRKAVISNCLSNIIICFLCRHFFYSCTDCITTILQRL